MSTINFTGISGSYSEKSIIQRHASDILIELLNIGKTSTILDIGCGTGKITGTLARITEARVLGIDPSEGMIRQAVAGNSCSNIRFEIGDAEKIHFNEEFDIIFCNSAMQWFRNIQRVFDNFYTTLKPGGRVGIQAPATTNYCPAFIAGTEQIRNDPVTGEVFNSFSIPWFFCDSPEEYRQIVEKAGFKAVVCRIDEVRSKHSTDEAFTIFSSGASAGYLNQDYYTMKIDNAYITRFESIMKQTFTGLADDTGMLELTFFRIYIIAEKPYKL